MKHQGLLPGIDLPTPPPPPDTNEPHGTSDADWPDMHSIMGSLLVCETTSSAPRPVTVLGLGMLPAAGPLDEVLPPTLLTAVRQAQTLAGGTVLLERCGFFHGETIPLAAPLEHALSMLETRQSQGRNVVVLADGDPLFFGIGATLVRRLGVASVNLLPGVSCLQLACARLGLPWHEVRCVSLHGREDLHPLNVAVGAGQPVCVLTDAQRTPAVLARHLLDRGVDWFEMHIFERLGDHEESHVCMPLPEAAGTEYGPACTVLLRPVGTPRRPLLGLGDDMLAVEQGLLTKGPVRAAALSLLRILPRHLIWDVGAGSGAVALEAAALAHQGRVIAIERSTGRAVGIKENRRRCGAANLDIHIGEAPDCFPKLPTPDRIFIGGGLSGDAGEDILAHCCDRLAPGGRLVVSCVLMGSLQRTLDFFQSTGWPLELASIQPALAAPLAGDLRLTALNPVFLAAVQKPDE